ncbi:hypothetical protein HPB51_001896 [Rhipicephalus microplus]|uniref:Cation efflux protein transmembrane domain-containing protein n=1 Tax=Rhipicephalus microplus TaxID=6941 RepID=A0A9J6DSC6_RHIMP|nr:hypothetical protein HPB51_001896 [Rhipicephalus microplus]
MQKLPRLPAWSQARGVGGTEGALLEVMGGCCCHRAELGRRGRLLLMFGMTTAFFLVEIIVGYVTNSMALVADSFHMLSDVISLVIAFLSIKVSHA